VELLTCSPSRRSDRRRALRAQRAASAAIRRRDTVARAAGRYARAIARADDLALAEAVSISRARQGFWAFRCFLGGGRFKRGWWQEECAAELQRFYDDMVAGRAPMLVFEAPPQHGKSRQVVEFIAWCSGKNPHLRAIYASFSARLGTRANRTLQRIFASVRFRQVFPEFGVAVSKMPMPDGTPAPQKTLELVEYVRRSGEPGAEPFEGSFRNTTVGGPINGEGLDLGVIDDPLKGRKAANSETTRESTWEWFTDDFFSRFSEHAGLLVIATRWHVEDPVGKLRREFPDDVRVISYSAIAKTDEVHRREGEPLFPEHKSLAFLRKRERAMAPANWESVYQQNPIIPGGNVIKVKCFQFYKNPLPILEHRCIVADTAQKTKTANDYSVLLCAGRTRDPGRMYILDIDRGKWPAPELRRRATAFWNKHKAAEVVRLGQLRRMLIEDKASGTGLIQEIQAAGNIPVEGLEVNADKYTRVSDVLGYIEAGLVYLPEDAPWLADFLAECERFTADDSHDHDDQVDVLVYAIMAMLADSSESEWKNL
jgi:predicted phage terminase large subunit-like protein